MPRRKPSNPSRRNVTGDGIGGLPGPAQPSSPSPSDHPLAGHSSPAAPGNGDVLPSDVDMGGEIAPEGRAEEESLFAVQGWKEDGEEDEDEDEEEPEHVEVAPSSSRKKRPKMTHGEGGRSLVGEQFVGSRCLPLHPLGSLKEMRGLRVMVPPPPGRAMFVRNARTARFAVTDDDENENENENENDGDANGDGDGDGVRVDGNDEPGVPKPASGELELGVFVEFSGGWEGVEGSLEARPGMLIRMDPEIFSAIEDLDQGGFIAFSAARPGATSPASSPPSSLAPAASVAPMVPGATLSPTALEFHLLSKAAGEDGPRVNVPKWQLLVSWLFPKAVEGFYRRPVGGYRGGTAEEDESPPSAAEILHALDAARGTDPDLHAAIQRGPDGPIPELRELIVNLRHHQKAAIHWMLDIEQGPAARSKPSEARRESQGDTICVREEEEREAHEEIIDVMAVRGAARDTGESTVAEELERAAFLLGWVKLSLAPPTSAERSQGEYIHAVGGAAGNGNDGAGVDRGTTRPEDTQAGRSNGKNGKTRRQTRRGTDANASQAATPLPGALTRENQAIYTAGWSGVLSAGLGHVWFHVPSARLVEELPTTWVAFSGVSGGILADEMGLGKTVEMLGCILANPYRSPGGNGHSSNGEKENPRDGDGDGNGDGDRDRDEEGEGDTEQSAQDRSGYWDDLTPTDEGSACVCGRGDDEPLVEGDLCFVRCDSCGWWLHGGCCGFVPTAEDGEDERPFTCVVCSCIVLLKSPKRCGSTLIICPHKIRSQWEMEIRARTKAGALKVAVYNGVREIVSLGEKSKLASSKRRQNAKRRRSADATGGGSSSSTSTSTSRRKKASRAGGDGNTTTSANTAIETEEQQHEGGYGHEHDNLRGQKEQEVSMHGRGGETPSGAEAGSSSGSGAPGAAEANAREACGQDDDALPRGEASATVMPSSISNRGGDVDGNDPFALLSPDKLATFDIVLTTFEVLRAEVHHAESRFANILGKGGAAEAGRPSLRRKKRYRVIPSPLPALKWWRVVVDEAHMVESTTQETAKMALKIPATHRWCVTGTPIGKGSIDDLYGLLVFLKASPLDSKAVWEKAVREPIDRRLPGAMERLAVALKRVMWRVTKASVAAQINIPPQTCVDRRLSFSSVEEHFYRKQHRAAAADAQKTAREGGRGAEEKIFNSLLALRQACCHPCIGSGGIETSGGGSRLGGGLAGAGGAGGGGGGGGQGRWLSMDQILDRLIDEERLKAEEAQRKVILHLNASGAVARLILQAQERRKEGERSGEAAEGGGGDGGQGNEETLDTLLRDSIHCYRRALQMAEDNRTPGPITGGAEVTGSRTMLPPALKRPRPTAGARSSKPSASSTIETDASGAAASAAAAAVFMELRKPLVLSWEVDLAPTAPTGSAGGGPAGSGMEVETAAAVAEDGKGGVEVRGRPEKGASIGPEDGKGGREMKNRDESRQEGVVGVGAAGEERGATGGEGGKQEEELGTGLEGTGGGFECAGPRDPAWARLVFADRKRVLRVRVRCSRDDDQHTHLDPASEGAHANESTRAGATMKAKAADRPAHKLRPGSNASEAAETAAAAAAAGIKEAVATEVIPGAPGETAEGGVEADGHRGGSLPVCYPRVCALQASSQAGGTFEDVVRFSVEPPPPTGVEVGVARTERNGEETATAGTSEGEGGDVGADGLHPWQEVVVPANRSARGREWRIVVETCQVLQATGTGASGLEGGGHMHFGMEVELREAEVDADSLQMLHAAHNLLEVLDHAKELQLPARQTSPVQTKEQGLKQLVDGIKASYVATAVGVHRSSRLQLEEAGRASAEALEAAATKRIGGLEWWEVALRYMENTRDDGNFARRAQLELLHEKAGQHTVMVRRSFPTFASVGGLRMALSVKIKEAHTKRKGVLRKLKALSTEPGPMEVHSNSNCRRCRADWGKTGPICGHCKVEESIIAWEACVVYFRRPLKNTGAGGGSAALAPALGRSGNDGSAGPGVNNAHQGHTFKEPSATPRLLRLIQRWVKEQARGGAAGGGGASTLRHPREGEAEDWTALSAESKDFLASWEASERELLCSRALWRAHLDLLSNIDELASCVTPLRLADEGEERLDLLTEDQRRMVLSEGVLGIRRREYELERQAAAHDLESSRGQLAYLSTLVREGSGSSSGSTRECTVCQEDLIEEVAVLPCGHTFHPECVSFLRKVGGGGRFRCPTCRRSSGTSDVRFASTLDQSDGSTSGLPVKGSWGTKITALVGDILALGPSDKCLVFSQWDDMLDIVELAFKENQVSYARMKGKKRSELALEAFRTEGGPRALMLPIKTGSHGLNLVEANHVFLLEPLLNAAVEAQAVNRVHRGGQTRPTTIHRFVVRGTIEEDIERLRKKKMSVSRLANGALSPTSKARGKGKGKGKYSSPVRPAISAAARSLDDHVVGAQDVEEVAAGGVNTMTVPPASLEERHPQQGGGRCGGGGDSGQAEGLREEEEEEEEEEDTDGEGKGEGEGDPEEANQLEEEEAAGLLVGSLTAATSERRALSLDDLKALLR